MSDQELQRSRIRIYSPAHRNAKFAREYLPIKERLPVTVEGDVTDSEKRAMSRNSSGVCDIEET